MTNPSAFKIDLSNHGEVSMKELVSIVQNSIAEQLVSQNQKENAQMHLEVIAGAKHLLSLEVAQIIVDKSLNSGNINVEFNEDIFSCFTDELKNNIKEVIDNFNELVKCTSEIKRLMKVIRDPQEQSINMECNNRDYLH